MGSGIRICCSLPASREGILLEARPHRSRNLEYTSVRKQLSWLRKYFRTFMSAGNRSRCVKYEGSAVWNPDAVTERVARTALRRRGTIPS